VALVALACAVTVTVAAAVIGLRWHYLTDTVAGAAVGVAAVITLALLLDVGQGRRGAGRRAPTAVAREPGAVSRVPEAVSPGPAAVPREPEAVSPEPDATP